MIEIINLPVTSFQQNCRIVSAAGDSAALVIDPGGDANHIVQALEKADLELTEIWLTHSHLDHCGGVSELLEHRKVPLTGHSIESDFRSRVEDICRMYGVPSGEMSNCPEPDRFVEGGETLTFGSLEFQVLFTPGHSPGHVCFYHQRSGNLFAGDTVFAGSIGRSDLPGGDHATLLRSIREVILTLPDDTNVLPGHGPDTTVGVERQSNPFLVS